MRKVLFITILLGLVTTIAAQTKSQRRIYLWDVTLSMKGKTYPNGRLDSEVYDSEKNIYNDVRGFLVNEIKNIENGTEIIVLPFQEEAKLSFDPWIVQANENGKRNIIQKIVDYKNDSRTGTDIVGVIRFAKENLVKNGKENTLILLTDGTQSRNLSGGDDALIELIKDWKEYAKANDTRLLYIMLNDKGIPNKKVLGALKKEEDSQTLSIVTDFIILEPSIDHLNVKDNKGRPVVINFESKNNANPNLPKKMLVNVHSTENPYIHIDQPRLELDKGLKISFRLNDEENVRNKMLGDKVEQYTVNLKIDLLNQKEIQQEGKTVTISPDSIKLVLINKPVKTLTIRYVE
jgi:hypothetical protein